MAAPLWIRRLLARIEAGFNGYLPQVGWIETRAQFRALDAAGEAAPWFTYPAIKFLEARVKPEWRILEFGSGMGTIWWSRSAERVVSLEHDPEWLEQISHSCPAQLLKTNGKTPADYMRPARDSGPYDIVIVDGLFREECLLAAPELLTKSGIIILDDAQRFLYRGTVNALLAKQFRILEFHGPQPVSKHPGCTAIFYRDDNVLDI